MTINEIKRRINFHQPKYMLPAIIYFPVLFAGYFFFRFFDLEKNEVTNLETTEYLNEKLPEANIKGDGIGNKYSAMLDSYGKITDATAVENIDRNTEKELEEYTSKYSDAEIAAMDSSNVNSQKTITRLRQLQEQIKQEHSRNERLLADSQQEATDEEEATLEELRRALADARGESAQEEESVTETPVGGKTRESKKKGLSVNEERYINENAVNEIAEDSEPEEVVKKHKAESDYFNTIVANEPQSKLIRAIVDEDIKVQQGSRLRLRLLDDIDIGERTLRKGTCLYCTLNGFSQQRVKGSIKSVFVEDELVKVSLSIYDTDGLEGLYVPNSNFRETSKDVVSGALSQNINMNDGMSSENNTMKRWSSQALQNAVQKVSSAFSKSVRKNIVRVKYGTQVYLINSKTQNKR